MLITNQLRTVSFPFQFIYIILYVVPKSNEEMLSIYIKVSPQKDIVKVILPK